MEGIDRTQQSTTIFQKRAFENSVSANVSFIKPHERL
jgi:hypothetical protein